MCAEPEPTATVVCSGVPARNVCDWPGATVTVCAPPAGGLTVTLTTPGVSVAVTWAVERSSEVVVVA